MPTPQTLDFVTLDVFTTTRYAGNPLAIVRIPPNVQISQDQKQAIAREFNLSETTFLHEVTAVNADAGLDTEQEVWTVDIFMTSKELPFAGHPTIGTACYVLARSVYSHAQDGKSVHAVIKAKFKLKAGIVGLEYNVARGTARASIPHDVRIHSRKWTRNEMFAHQPSLAAANHEGNIKVRNDFAVVSIVKGMTFVLIELESLEALQLVGLSGRPLAIDGLDKGWDQTFVGTYYFVRTGRRSSHVTSLQTRMLEGTLEDPATGSAASDLAAYLALTEGEAHDLLRYEITQGVEMGRKSDIFIDVELAADKTISELYLEGAAVQIMEGRIEI